jgi:hypothetical protein
MKCYFTIMLLLYICAVIESIGAHKYDKTLTKILTRANATGSVSASGGRCPLDLSELE